MKRGVFIIVIMFLLYAAIASAARVDHKVEKEIQNKGEVSVIVMLKDDISIDKEVSASSLLKTELLERRIENRKSMVSKKQHQVLSRLKINEEKKGLSNIESRDYDLKLKNTYSVINGFSGTITEEGLEKLKEDPDVAQIYYDDVRYLTLPTSVPQINADDVWSLRPNGTNLTGLGQTVCVIDSGIDYTHPNLGNCSTENFTSGNCAKVISGWDYRNDDNDPRDDHGHGTHVAGIVASNHTTNRGVAPDAKLVALKVCDNSTNGACAVSDIISGIDWCINNKTLFNITVITMSIGGGSYSAACDSQADANASNVAVANGIFVSIATGNSGSSTQISAPACASNATAVGSVDVP